MIVKKEIESWYIAGLSDTNLKKLKIKLTAKGKKGDITGNMTKEKFNKLMPKRFDSRIDFMLEILNQFSLNTAKKRNKSFSYFISKHDC